MITRPPMSRPQPHDADRTPRATSAALRPIRGGFSVPFRSGPGGRRLSARRPSASGRQSHARDHTLARGANVNRSGENTPVGSPWGTKFVDGGCQEAQATRVRRRRPPRGGVDRNRRLDPRPPRDRPSGSRSLQAARRHARDRRHPRRDGHRGHGDRLQGRPRPGQPPPDPASPSWPNTTRCPAWATAAATT